MERGEMAKSLGGSRKVASSQRNQYLSKRAGTTLSQQSGKSSKGMTSGSKLTSSILATKASKILRDGRYSKASKSLAGSVLSNYKKKK
jgi:hypothetical protein